MNLKFYDFVDAPDKDITLKSLKEWYVFVATQNEPKFITCMNTITNLQKYILNSFTCPYRNGYTEGVNNKIKGLKEMHMVCVISIGLKIVYSI